MGSSTPDGEQYTRTERVQCIPIGCRALTNKHNRGALSLAVRRMPLGGIRGAVAAGWTVCGACGCDTERGVSAWVAVRAGATPSVGYRRGLRGCLCDVERGVSAWVAVLRVRQ